ncbi:hypothetical protein RHMOL_Rhmol08G0192900 [Rhododendron molle]|uniref:Uncharacterized protein n=1 Tax=Rhododendron molle TaxID=49168 RepID=A0ACC0MR58_RHOML|nr:hypothetical protein RHMOL_Rhmol08G0192900 [Rhododendron molle]
MCGKTRRDRIKNETFREMVGVAPIEEKLWENRLRWFGHVYRRLGDAVVKRADRIALGSNATGTGRPKLTLDAVVRKDLSIVGLVWYCLNYVKVDVIREVYGFRNDGKD